MEGHGDHWSCLGESKEVIAYFLPLVCDDSERDTFYGGKISVENPETGQEHMEKVISFTGPERDDFCALALLVSDSVKGGARVWSAYPFAKKGIPHEIKITAIEEWKNTLEARIEGETEDGAEIGFFDTLYHLNKEKYEIGKTYPFMLSGLAYNLKIPEDKGFKISDPEKIRGFREKMSDAGIDFPEEDDEPIEFSLGGAAIFLPIEDWDVDDFSFRAPVRHVSSFQLEGQTVHAVTAIVLRPFGPDDEDFDLTIYAADHAIEGEPPKQGDDISGSLWLQGYLIEEDGKP